MTPDEEARAEADWQDCRMRLGTSGPNDLVAIARRYFMEGRAYGADARKVEVTEEMVEAAARAINIEGWTYLGEHEPGEYCDDCRRVSLRVARAALSAALGGEGW